MRFQSTILGTAIIVVCLPLTAATQECGDVTHCAEFRRAGPVFLLRMFARNRCEFPIRMKTCFERTAGASPICSEVVLGLAQERIVGDVINATGRFRHVARKTTCRGPLPPIRNFEPSEGIARETPALP